MRRANVTYPEMWKKVKKIYDQTKKQVEVLPWIGDVELMAAGEEGDYAKDAKDIYEEMIEYEQTLEDFLMKYKNFQARKISAELRWVAKNII